MTQPAPLAIRSPCIKLCVIEPESGYCIGCGRSREEIASWISLSPQQRNTVALLLAMDPQDALVLKHLKDNDPETAVVMTSMRV